MDAFIGKSTNKSTASQDHFNCKLLDMGRLNKQYESIHIPESEIHSKRIGISENFLSNAEAYYEKYTNHEYFEKLIRRALKQINFSMNNPSILDVGSGAGNTIFPCLNIFPNASIIACDLSPDLLLILNKVYNRHYGSNKSRITTVCFDAMKDVFSNNTFDLVIGGAILHHLINPATTIINISKALKPGGSAIFFEPFENGNAILLIAYTEIVKALKDKHFNNKGKIVNFFNAMILAYKTCIGTDKTSKIFEEIDDKWLFTKSYFEDAARQAGFSRLIITPLHDTKQPFKAQTIVNLRLACNLEATSLPEEANKILDYYDEIFSNELKKDLLIEGSVIMTK